MEDTLEYQPMDKKDCGGYPNREECPKFAIYLCTCEEQHAYGENDGEAD